jgi:hypothetical protein
VKYVVLFFALIGCGLAYVRYEKPDLWNSLLQQVLTSSQAAPSDNDTSTNSATAPAPEPPKPILITPYATNYINPDHVHDVEQPPQPVRSTNADGNPAAPQSP